ncbi:MAG: DoxX family membrane protein [Acidobacteria bacterium]|nr:DoxX family membrane protein [Acidobacteriota bacterium]
MAIFGKLGTPVGALRLLSLIFGVFLIGMGLTKLGWLTDSAPLVRTLQGWRGDARPWVLWYLDTVAIPGAPVFARVVLFAELAAGAALILGVRVRLAAGLTLLMVLNFHVASDVIFHYSYLTNGYGLPVLGGLLALALSGTRLPFSATS